MSSLATSFHQSVTVKKSKVTLTRRGRFILIGLPLLTAIVVFLFVLLSMVLAPNASATDANQPSVAVHSGQSLWTVAENLELHRDVRDVMSDIMKLNNLNNTVISPGERLYVPAQ
ncbi:MAG: LysM peptidoglycan-binding domain-containing protein [Micrococcaceae bacterium]